MSKLITLALIILNFGFISPVLAETLTAKHKVYFIGTNQYALVNAHSAEDFGVVIENTNLDGHKNLEQFLTKNLPQDMVAAEIEANRRLGTLSSVDLQNALKGITTAMQFSVLRAPAFVFDEGRAVVYGLTDAREALKRWAYYKSRSNSR